MSATPRILTFDNGGLQAISLLIVLKEVCDRLSSIDGHKTMAAPSELFDVIAGVGSGGWLAILLGRYRLRIEDCMSIYLDIAKAIDPARSRPSRSQADKQPVALNQDDLIAEIDSVIDSHRLDYFMQTENIENERAHVKSARQCHAFAVGVVKDEPDIDPAYHLFRTYQPKSSEAQKGPNPATCKVSAACAATAAAKHFLAEYEIEDETYLDNNFPTTHNISLIALKEAECLFNADMKPEFVLNMGSSLPTLKQTQSLEKAAYKNASTKVRVGHHVSSIRRVLSWPPLMRTMSKNDDVHPRSKSCPPEATRQQKVAGETGTPESKSSSVPVPDVLPLFNGEPPLAKITSRSSTSSSMKILRKNREHLSVIMSYLSARLNNDSDEAQLRYCRMHVRQTVRDPSLYVSDLRASREALSDASQFVKKNEVVKVFEHIENRARAARSTPTCVSTTNEGDERNCRASAEVPTYEVVSTHNLNVVPVA